MNNAEERFMNGSYFIGTRPYELLDTIGSVIIWSPISNQYSHIFKYSSPCFKIGIHLQSPETIFSYALILIRHSPPGMPYGFVRIFFILLPPRFPDDNFWPPRWTVPEFWPVTCHGHRKKCILFWPRVTPGWGRGAPQNPPPPKQNL